MSDKIIVPHLPRVTSGRINLLAVLLFVVFMSCLTIVRAMYRNHYIVLNYDHFMKRAIDFFYCERSDFPHVWEVRKGIPPALEFLGVTTRASERLLCLLIAGFFCPALFVVQDLMPVGSPSLYRLVPTFFGTLSGLIWGWLVYRVVCVHPREQRLGDATQALLHNNDGSETGHAGRISRAESKADAGQNSRKNAEAAGSEKDL